MARRRRNNNGNKPAVQEKKFDGPDSDVYEESEDDGLSIIDGEDAADEFDDSAAVMDIDDGDSDEDEDDEEANPAGKGDERLAWGRKTADFYVDTEDEGTDNDEDEGSELEEIKMNEIREAQLARNRLVRARDVKHAGPVAEEDEEEEEEEEGVSAVEQAPLDLDALDDVLDFVPRAKTLGTEDRFKDLSQEQKRKLLKKEAPEFVALLKEYKEKAALLDGKIIPLMTAARSLDPPPTKGAMTYVEVKLQLLLSYLTNLSYYMYLKCQGVDVKTHPAMEQLSWLRGLMERLTPIDQKLRYQIEKLLSATESGDMNDDGGALSYKPDAQNMSRDVRAEDDAQVLEDGDGKYRPLKFDAVEMVDADTKAQRRLERIKDKAKRSEIVKALRNEFLDAPEEVGSETLLGKDRVDSIKRKLKERQDYEESNLTRMNLSKKDKRDLKHLMKSDAGKRASGAVVSLQEATDFNDLARIAENEDVDPTLGIRRKSNSSNVQLAAALNTAKQAQESASRKNRPSNDDNVEARKMQSRSGPVHPSDEGIDWSSGPKTIELPPEDSFGMIAMAKQKREEKLQRRREDLAEKSKKSYMNKMDESVGDENKRKISRDIAKNKGLTRKRKKEDRNARVKNRGKYEKAQKRRKGAVVDVRHGHGDGSYGGEATGLRTHVKKSTNIA